MNALQASYYWSTDSFAVSYSNIEISISLAEPACVRIWLAGCRKTVYEAEEQLKWLGSALRLPRHHGIECSRAVVNNWQIQEGTLTVIEFVTEPISTEDLMICWVPLFSDAVIARGLTAPRSDEMGLEMSFDMMVALAGVHHAVTFEGGLLLKGFSAILVPTKSYPDSIQWHFLHLEDEGLHPYKEVKKQCSSRILGNKISFESMRKKRAFVGWCRKAETSLGAKHVEYANIGYSPNFQATRSNRIAETQIGFQYTININFNLKYGPKYGKFHSRRGTIQEIIEHAERTPLILCDVGERKNWLVRASDVILHMIYTKHAQTSREGNGLNPIYLDPDRDSFPATYQFLLTNADADYGFRELVQKYWSFIDDCQATNIEQDMAPGIPIRNPWRTTIEGWDFMALVKEDSPRDHKSATIKATGGGWPYLAKDTKAIVLFATGLGDIIRPVSSDGVCKKLMTLPLGNDYLAADVSMLNELFRKTGNIDTQRHITNKGLRWHKPSKLFEDCCSIGKDNCGCDRLQQLVPRRRRCGNIISRTIFGPVVPPGKLEPQGAVIFGQTRHHLLLLSAASRFLKPVQDSRRRRYQLNQRLENLTINKENNALRSVRPRDEGEDSGSEKIRDPGTKRRRTSRARKREEIPEQNRMSWKISAVLHPTTDLVLQEIPQTSNRSRSLNFNMKDNNIPSSDTIVPEDGAY